MMHTALNAVTGPRAVTLVVGTTISSARDNHASDGICSKDPFVVSFTVQKPFEQTPHPYLPPPTWAIYCCTYRRPKLQDLEFATLTTKIFY